MKKYTIPSMLCLCVIVSVSAMAGESADRVSPGSIHVDTAQERLALSVVEGQKKEGMLELFVDGDVSSRHAAQDSPASDLNAISPAAGVQFRLEF